MARPAKLTRNLVQAAALEIVDREGVGALSIRRLARHLGTGAMTLYNYVGDRDELDGLVVDAVMAEVVLPEPAGDWRLAVRGLAEAAWQVLHDHPQAIPLVLARRVLQPGSLAWAEAMLQALARGGLRGETLLAAFRLVNGLIFGLAQTYPGPAPAPDPAAPVALALPPDGHERLREIAAAAVAMTPEMQLRAGLDILLAGLAAGGGTEAGA